MVCPVLVGRREEMATLEDALRAAMIGEGRAVLISGEAGMGKTRLVSELARRAEELGCIVLRGGCSEGELSLPYMPFVEAIGSYLLGVDKAWLRDQLGDARRELAQLFPQLEAVPPPEADDPVRAKLRLFEAIATLFHVAAGGSGLVIALEDVHWADASTRELLEYLVRRLARSGWLLVPTYRSEEVGRRHPFHAQASAWLRTRTADRVELSSLRREEVGEMIRAIFDRPEVTREYRDFFATRTEGNPFVIEEMLKEQVEEGVIRRLDDGSWRRDTDAGLRLPTTVADSILTRLERLDPAEAEVLRAAAVLGRSFAYDTLVDLVEADPTLVQRALQSGVTQQLVEPDPNYPSRYTFRHALTRDAVYGDLLVPTRQSLHLRAAAVLRGRPGTAAVELAGHLLAADHWEEALPICMSAAEDAVRRRGYREAAELYEKVLPHLADRAERARVRCRLGEAHWRAGDPTTAQRHLEEGIGELEAGVDTSAAAHFGIVLGRCYWETGQLERARERYEKSRATLASGGASEDLASACVGLAGLFAFELRGPEAQHMAEQAVAIAGEVGAEAALIRAYGYLGIGLVFQGRISEGLAHLDRSYQEALEHDYDNNAMTALYNSIIIRIWHLRARECRPLVEKLRQLPDSFWRNLAYARARATMSLRLGDLEAALESARAVQQMAEDGGASTFVNWARRMQALVQVEMGNVNQAFSVLPPETDGEDRQELFFDYEVRVRAHLAAGDVEAAGRLGALIAANGPWSQDAIAVGAGADGLTAAGRLPETETLLAAAVEDGVDPTSPYLLAAAARLHLARGDASTAAEQARAAAHAFGEAEYVLDELRARVTLAVALARAGDQDYATAELGALVERARVRGLRAVVEEATRSGGLAGLEILPPRPGADMPLPTPSVGEERVSVVSELRRALRLGEFALYYQPKRNLRSQEVDWCEALVRWQNPHRGMVAPDQFVPIIEQLGMVQALTTWVIEAAVQQLRRWMHDGRRIGVSVNLSVHDLEEPRFPDAVARALESSQVPPSRLILEVTEGSAMQKPELALKTLHQLSALGVGLSIDDFGTGHSSLSYVRQLPVMELKIDKSFCLEMDEKNLVIIRSAIRMGHDLGLKVTAEGVDQPETLQLLAAMACDYAQGYLVGRPMPAADLERLVDEMAAGAGA